jgi:hypothetical protein
MNMQLPPFVQDHFDRGLDPLCDATVRAWLEERPELLPAFAALRAALFAAEDLPADAALRHRRTPLALAAGVAALLLGGLVWWLASAPAAAPATALPRPLLAPANCVLAITTSERVADDTSTFACAIVQGTLSRRSVATFSTMSLERGPASDLRTAVRTTIHTETILP